MLLQEQLCQYNGMASRLNRYNAATDETLPGYLSQCTLISLLHPQLFKEGLRDEWQDMIVKWLNHTYQFVLLNLQVEPDSAVRDITRALLNNRLAEEWKPAYISEKGEVTFIEASKFRLIDDKPRVEIKLQQPTPFPFNTALKEGLKKIFCAVKIAHSMETYAECHGFYLGDKSTAIIELIKAIHAANPKTLSTGEHILAFDHKSCILDFLMTKRAWLIQQ